MVDYRAAPGSERRWGTCHGGETRAYGGGAGCCQPGQVASGAAAPSWRAWLAAGARRPELCLCRGPRVKPEAAACHARQKTAQCCPLSYMSCRYTYCSSPNHALHAAPNTDPLHPRAASPCTDSRLAKLGGTSFKKSRRQTHFRLAAAKTPAVTGVRQDTAAFPHASCRRNKAAAPLPSPLLK